MGNFACVVAFRWPVKQRIKNTMIVALTANAMIEEQSEFLKDGMNSILTKPLSREALSDLLQQVGSEIHSYDQS